MINGLIIGGKLHGKPWSNTMNDDIDRKRADLTARIEKARANLVYIKRCERDLAKKMKVVRKGKTKLLRAAPLADRALVEQSNNSIALSESAFADAAKSVAKGKATAMELLRVLQAELDGL